MNLVFDKWDTSGKPIPNLSDLNTKMNMGIITNIDFVNEFDMEENEIKLCKLSDINKDDNFYYVISYLDECCFLILNRKVYLTEEVRYHISHNNLKVIFISTHESPGNLTSFITVLNNDILENNWKEENFYIINNNSSLYELKNDLKSNINFHKSNSLLKMLGSEMKIQPKEENIIFDKKFIFLFQNRLPHEHRIVLLTYLKNLNLLENEIINWSLVMDYNEYIHQNRVYSTINSIANLNKKYINPKDKNLIKNYTEILKTKKLDFYEQNVNWFENSQDYTQIDHITLESYQNSYINIVPETNYNFKEYDIHITEKSFKPFYYFQIPIFLASHNHVKKIREEYDFFLFDDIINHSYDDEKDDAKRLNMIVKEISRLAIMREDIVLYYKENINKILHNHNYVKNYSDKKVDKNYFLSL